jgi:hypothetical protein
MVAKHGREEIVRMILSSTDSSIQADINKNLYAAIDEAISAKQHSITDILLEAAKTTKLTDHQWVHIFSVAAEKHDAKVARMILNNNKKAVISDDDIGCGMKIDGSATIEGAVMSLSTRQLDESIALVKELIDASGKYKDSNIRWAIVYAAKNDNTKFAETLIKDYDIKQTLWKDIMSAIRPEDDNDGKEHKLYNLLLKDPRSKVWYAELWDIPVLPDIDEDMQLRMGDMAEWLRLLGVRISKAKEELAVWGKEQTATKAKATVQPATKSDEYHDVKQQPSAIASSITAHHLSPSQKEKLG